MTARSPLKETDANLRQPRLNEDGSSIVTNKKRALERLESQQQHQLQHQQQRKKPRIERTRSIEGAVQVGKNTALKNNEQKVTPSELLEWQNNWKKIMRRESRIYFDTTDESDCSKFIKNRMDKRKELLKKGFLSLGAQITQFFDSSVTIVITRRCLDTLGGLSDSDILSRAKKNYMKVWGYEKATRFLKNLDVDLELLEKKKTASLPEPTLSNLLQNEKLYGPTDRDPRTRRDDIHYFKFAHVYMYDIWQTWAPIIVLEWKPQDLADPKKMPYPVLRMGTFGRCPFIGDGSCDETSYKRVVKRYSRDKANKKYALRLRLLYQHHAEPSVDSPEIDFIPHTCLDSKQCYDNWQRILAVEEETSSGNNNNSNNNNDDNNDESLRTKSKSIWKEPEPVATLPVPVSSHSIRKTVFPVSAVTALAKEETEDFPDDLCNNRKKSRTMQEQKASGIHQSNDVGTSFGNGLGPTKASVTNRNIKNLSKLVVDKKLGTRTPTANIAGTTGATSTANANANNNNAITNTSVTEETHGIVCHEVSATTPNNNNTNNNNIMEKDTEKNSSSYKKKKAESVTPAVARRDNAKNSGYCENCRVKYDSLEQHIVSDKHQSFAQNDLNFEMIDSLIDKLKFQF